MGKPKITILYLCLHNLLKKRYGVNNTITKKELFCELGKHYLVPKKLRPIIIKEMEEVCLLKQESSGSITLLKCDIDLENDANKFYERFKIF